MAIKIAPKEAPKLTDRERELFERVKRKNVRKPSGKAKEAVTLRLTKPCCARFHAKFGDDWRAEMQKILEWATI